MVNTRHLSILDYRLTALASVVTQGASLIRRGGAIFFLSLVGLAGCASTQQVADLQQVVTTSSDKLSEKIDEQQMTLLTQRSDMMNLVNMNQVLYEQNEYLAQSVRSLERKMSQTQSAVNALPVAAKAPVKTKKIDGLTPSKLTLGRVEWLWVDRLQRYVKARIDTGAKSSSLHASDVVFFERDGKDWVRYRLHTHDKIPVGADGKKSLPAFESPVVRTVKIKQASSDEMELRAVIALRVRIAEHEEDAEFTLSDRANMLYPALVGRNILADIAVVDVSRAFFYKRKDLAVKASSVASVIKAPPVEKKAESKNASSQPSTLRDQ